jgi:MoaA/NifB/PqqE/SkfB family radical SAM enzyme
MEPLEKFRRRIKLLQLLDKFALSIGNPALAKLVPFRPAASEVRVTENCNSRCITCRAWRNRSTNELTVEEFKDIFLQLRRLGVSCIAFTGGEPLLRRDIGRIVMEARLSGFEEVMLITNGLLLEQKAQDLIDSGLTHLLVSIDGLDGTDNRIKGIPSHFDRAIRGIYAASRFKENKKADVKIVVLTTLTQLNVKEVPALIEECHKLGVRWFFNLLEASIDIFAATDMSTLRITNHQTIDNLFDCLENLRIQFPSTAYFCNHQLDYARSFLKRVSCKIPCFHGYQRINIGAHGEVYSGCFVLKPMGNVREEKLSRIIRKKTYRKRMERMYTRQCPGCTNLWGEQVLTKHAISHDFRCQNKGQDLLKRIKNRIRQPNQNPPKNSNLSS